MHLLDDLPLLTTTIKLHNQIPKLAQKQDEEGIAECQLETAKDANETMTSHITGKIGKSTFFVQLWLNCDWKTNYIVGLYNVFNKSI